MATSQTAQAVENLKSEQSKLEEEAAHLIAYGDYILNQVQAAREMNRSIDGVDLREYVLDFLSIHYPGCNFRQTGDEGLRWEVGLSPAAKHALATFIEANELASFTRLLQSSGMAPVVFDNRAATSHRGAEETISQLHPLVRFAASQQQRMTERLRPAVAIRIPQRALGDHPLRAGVYALAIQLWSLTGVQSIERLAYAGIRLSPESASLEASDAERLALLAAAIGETWHAAANEVALERAYELVNEELFGALDERFATERKHIEAQNEDRASVQLKSLEKHFASSRLTLEAVRAGHLAKSRAGLAKATAGRLAALSDRVEVQKLRIEQGRKLTSNKAEVAVALIQVVGE